MKEKICLVTGANSGLGKEVALGLAQKGARVILVCRNKQKGEIALNEIKRITGNELLDLLVADLSLMSSVKNLALEFRRKYSQLDVLVLNAGAFFYKRQITEEGLERTAALNYLSRFLLVNLLSDSLKKSNSARIINIVGGMIKRIDFTDFMMESKYSGNLALAKFTFANILFIHGLIQKNEFSGISANYYNPGAIRTEMAEKDNDLPRIIKLFFKFLKPFFKSPKKAAIMIITLALSSDMHNISGKYYSGEKEKPPPTIVFDKLLQKKLWTISYELTNTNKMD